MYQTHFNLKLKPFRLIPEADFIYISDKHRSAFATLEYGIFESDGITLLTGDVGTGKTTLLRHLLTFLNDEDLEIGLISNTHSSFGSLLPWIVNSFQIKINDKSSLLNEFESFLIDRYSEGKKTVLIIDEAQNLNSQDMEALRLLTNINSDDCLLFQLVLIGQPELLEIFTNPNMSQLAQRVSSEYHLSPFDLNETKKYIHSRLLKSGGITSLFDEIAIKAIFYYSGGVPRIVNTLCDAALVHTYGNDKNIVTLQSVIDVVTSKQIGGILRQGLLTDVNRLTTCKDVLNLTGIDLSNFTIIARNIE